MKADGKLRLLDADPATCRLIELRRLRAGELEGAELERVQGHARSCAACAARLQGLDREEQRLRELVDPAVESARVLERLERAEQGAASGRAPLTSWLGWLSSLRQSPALAAGVLLAIALPVLLLATRRPDDATTRLKGVERPLETRAAPSLEMWVKDTAGIRRATEGELLGEGDQIQFRYQAAGRRFVFVVSVTSGGAIDPLYPDTRGVSVEIQPAGSHVLEGSVILDDARGDERVLAFFSEAPIAYGELEPAVRAALLRAGGVGALGHVELGRPGVEVVTLMFRKE